MFTPSLRAAIRNLELLHNQIVGSKIPGISYQLARDIAALTEWAGVYEPLASRRLPLDTMIALHEIKLEGVDPEPYRTGTWGAFLATHGEGYPYLEAALCRGDEYDVATTRVRLAKPAVKSLSDTIDAPPDLAVGGHYTINVGCNAAEAAGFTKPEEPTITFNKKTKFELRFNHMIEHDDKAALAVWLKGYADYFANDPNWLGEVHRIGYLLLVDGPDFGECQRVHGEVAAEFLRRWPS